MAPFVAPISIMLAYVWLCLRASWLENYDRKVPTSTGKELGLLQITVLVLNREYAMEFVA